jgi:hypothetical protein
MLSERIYALKMQGRVTFDRAREEREVKAWQEIQQRQFQLKFNQLVAAVASFSKRYNEDKGCNRRRKYSYQRAISLAPLCPL